MRLPCPFCGERDQAEFVCKGAALPARPDPAGAGAASAFYDHLYPRDNPAGILIEDWYHAAGCRRWLRVRRNTRDHAVLDVAFAQGPDARNALG